MPLTTLVANQTARASHVNANFALCVLTDTARTITATHTWSAAQNFTDLVTIGSATLAGGTVAPKRLLAQYEATETSGTVETMLAYAEQTVATTGSTYASHNSAVATHPSGTVVSLFATKGIAVSAAAGAVTNLIGTSGQVKTQSGTSGNVTGIAAALFGHAADLAGSGTVTNLYGLYVQAQSGGTNNYAAEFATALRLDYSATTDDTRMLVWDVTAGALVRVTRGAADSGGSGFRLLRIPN